MLRKSGEVKSRYSVTDRDNGNQDVILHRICAQCCTSDEFYNFSFSKMDCVTCVNALYQNANLDPVMQS